MEQARDGTAWRLILEQTGSSADRGHHLEQVLEEVLRRRHQPQAQTRECSRGQHRPPPGHQKQDPDRRLDQLQGHRRAEGDPSPPAAVDPRPEPHPRERQQQQVDLTLLDVAGYREAQRYQNEHHRKLPVVHLQHPQGAPDEDGKRRVEDDDHGDAEQVAVDPDGRLQEPGQQRRHDVLGTGRFQTAKFLAEVVGIEPRRKAAGSPHVALLEVALIGSEKEWLHQATPQVQDPDREPGPNDKQPTKASVGQSGQTDHRRRIHRAEIIELSPRSASGSKAEGAKKRPREG